MPVIEKGGKEWIDFPDQRKDLNKIAGGAAFPSHFPSHSEQN
jgi:hypothetical protein